MKVSIENIKINEKRVLQFLGYSNRNVPDIIMKKIYE